MNPAISRSSRIWSVLLRGVQPKISPRVLRCKSCQRTSNIKSFSTSSGGKANTIDVNSSVIPNTSNTIGQVKSADALGGVEPIGGKSSEDPEIDKAKLDKLANLGTRKCILACRSFFFFFFFFLIAIINHHANH